MTSPSVIDVRGLRMSYGSHEVLRGVDLTVAQGEVVALLGPNGAGKTTTLEILEGFRGPTGGSVSVLGETPMEAPESWRARVGLVLQSWRDHGRWTPRELLHYLGQYYAAYSTPERPRPYDVEELIERVRLGPQAGQKIAALSGGQRRRLDVAIGVVGRPDVLFLDEPTTGFDPHARRSFHDLVHRLSDLEDTTILLTTHDLDEAEKLADRILILAGGRIVANGSAEQLAGQVATTSEVRWTRAGRRYVHTTPDATGYVRELFTRHGEAIGELEVRRATLEDTYINLVQRHEAGEELADQLFGTAATPTSPASGAPTQEGAH